MRLDWRPWCRPRGRYTGLCRSTERPMCASSALQECQQIGVDLSLQRDREAVWSTRVVDSPNVLDEAFRFARRVVHRNDLIVLSVHEQSGDVELLQVFGEIGLGERLDAFVGVPQAGLHAQPPEL